MGNGGEGRGRRRHGKAKEWAQDRDPTPGNFFFFFLYITNIYYLQTTCRHYCHTPPQHDQRHHHLQWRRLLGALNWVHHHLKRRSSQQPRQRQWRLETGLETCTRLEPQVCLFFHYTNFFYSTYSMTMAGTASKSVAPKTPMTTMTTTRHGAGNGAQEMYVFIVPNPNSLFLVYITYSFWVVFNTQMIILYINKK